MKAFRIEFESGSTAITLTVPVRANQWGEYVIRVRKNGKLQPDPIYFTSDREDAIYTAWVMSSWGWSTN